MKPITHPTTNDSLAPPTNMAPEDCRPLPITRLKIDNQINSVISYWQPTREQLARLAIGFPVRLQVLGSTHPPVALGVDGDGGVIQ
jgi:hypothetical protein